MSYSVKMWCGCSVYVACTPGTGLAHARIIEARHSQCRERRHEIGYRLWLWEMLPDPRTVTTPVFYPAPGDREVGLK